MTISVASGKEDTEECTLEAVCVFCIKSVLFLIYELTEFSCDN
jgi:hypothetical protein